jgi:two-component sensor histidine kinase/CHASE2 domain-containing sensor protein
MSRFRATVVLAIALTAALLGMWLSGIPDSILSVAELSARDAVARAGERTPANRKLIFLGIDAESIGLDIADDVQNLFKIDNPESEEAQALVEMSEAFPFRRTVHARIIERLVGAGAKVVAFDLLFTDPKDATDDARFRAALEKYRGQVVIGSNFTTTKPDLQKPAMISALDAPTDALIAADDPARDTRVGFVNFWPDADGVIRSAKFQINFSEFLSTSTTIGETDYASFAARIVQAYGMPQKVPSDTASRQIRFTGGPATGFPPRSVFEIFVPEYWERNFQGGAIFKDAIVVIGAAANMLHDEHQTPFGRMYGAEIQLNAVNAALQGAFIAPISPGWNWAVWLLACSLAVGANWWLSRPIWRLVVLLACAAAWIIFQVPLYNAGYAAPILGPALVLAITGFVTLVIDLAAAGAEQFRLKVALVERRRTQELLEEANTRLESRVNERTLQLTEANQVLTNLLKEKDVLLKEIHHRVKNNLQVISSLLNLQANTIEDPFTRQVFSESRNRVRSMALIHEKLYQSGDLSKIDFPDYIRALTRGLQSTFGGQASQVRIAVEAEEIQLSVDAAVPCGLIVNELVTNCFKYAFKDCRSGEVRVGLKRVQDARLKLFVSDDGVGFPKSIDFRSTDSLGMQIVTTLTEQLDGTISLRNGIGTTFDIEFPEPAMTSHD